MKERNAAFFGQRGDVITFNRGKEHFNVPHLQRLHNQLIDTINNRRYLILAPETLLSMQNQYIEAREKIHALKQKKGLSLIEQKENQQEIERLEAPTRELKKILHLIQTRGAATFDEIDSQFSPRKELNYPGVHTEKLDRISLDLVGALYEIAACDPELKQLGMDLHANNQPHLLPTRLKRSNAL